jgi:U3 small nucleolar RNA-associated protein 5
LDDDGKYKTEVRLEPASLGDSGGDGKPQVCTPTNDCRISHLRLQGVPLRRYNEHTAVISGANGSAGGVLTETGLHIDPETAELTLGERLLTLHGPQATGVAHKSGKKKNADDEDDAQNNVEAVPVNSLSRTLIQALHSSDSRLLESCLAYSQPSIIRNTVQLIPSQLAIPLISACVERLGRGRRGANMKGGGGGASAQRGTALLVWIKAVLVIHSGHLMAVGLSFTYPVSVLTLFQGSRFSCSPICFTHRHYQ